MKRAVIVLLLWLASGCALFGVDHPVEVLHLVQAERLGADAHLRVPDIAAAWRPVRLPDNWNESRPDQGGGVWYRFRLRIPDRGGAEIWGVLLRDISSNAEIWWDGELIASGGRMREPLARNWNYPLYASVLRSQAQPGEHQLHVYVRGYANDGGGLGCVYAGPARLVQPMFDDALFVKHTLSVMGLIFTLLLMIGVLFLWYLNRGHVVLKWLFIASLCWAVVLINFVVREPWLPRFYWETLVAQAPVDFYALALLILVHRILRLARLRLEQMLGGFLLAGWLVILCFGDDASIAPWSMPLHSAALLAAFYVVWICVQRWLQQRDTQAGVLAIAVTPEVLLGFHDWWMAYPGNQVEQMMLMHLGPPIALLIIGLWTLFRLLRSALDAGQQRERVEREVVKAADQLRREQARLAALEAERLINLEQERFSRELHEGLGSHLATLSSQLHDGLASEQQMAETVDRALLDMRLIIDIMRDDCAEIGMLLGVLRHRLHGWGEEHGMHLRWEMKRLAMGCYLAEAGGALAFLRIIQEALMNIVYHAAEPELYIQVEAYSAVKAGHLVACVEIIDESHALDEIQIHAVSMIVMHEWARQLCAALQFRPASNTRAMVSLSVPASREKADC